MVDFKLIHKPTGPHHAAVVSTAGTPGLPYAMILLHGRGGNASDILSWAAPFTDGYFVVAPEAVTNQWYPNRFIAQQTENEPHLSSALFVVDAAVESLRAAGYTYEQIVLAGFSQGACLASEYVKRKPAPYAGVMLMSGGLIGTDAEVTMGWSRGLNGVCIYLGSDVADAHIPFARVMATHQAFTIAGAVVTLELFEDYGHAPHPTASAFLKQLQKTMV